MELAKDLLSLAETVGTVPGLSTACKLAIQIISTIQKSNNNTKRALALVHFLTSYLINISEATHGKWDDVPDKLKEYIDEFEALLRQVLKLAVRHSKHTRFMALIFAGDYEADLAMLEQRLGAIQSSVLLLVGINTSIQVSRLQTSIDRVSHSQMSIMGGTGNQDPQFSSSMNDAYDIHSRTRRLENMILAGHVPDRSETPGIPVYESWDLQPLREIARDSRVIHGVGTTVTLTLHAARSRRDGQVVLVRTYGGSNSLEIQKKFSQDISFHDRIFESTVLHLIGSSRGTEKLPFQVYCTPSENLETFNSWLWRTSQLNPSTTLLGISDMIGSVRNLWRLQVDRSIVCPGNIFAHALVNVQLFCGRERHSLIYTGDFVPGFAQHLNLESVAHDVAIATGRPLSLARVVAKITGNYLDLFDPEHDEGQSEPRTLEFMFPG